MLGIHDLPLFIVSGLLLNITPGADALYIATRSISQGRRAGILAALGVSLGCCVHILAAALGLSALLTTSTLAFSVIRWLGAAYLVYVGISLLRAPSAPRTAGVPAADSMPRIFMQGFLTNVLNPKIALFFLAFMPQFIDPAATEKALAFIFLGSIFVANGTLWCLFWAWACAHLGALGIGRRTSTWFGRGVGLVFVALGARLALNEA